MEICLFCSASPHLLISDRMKRSPKRKHWGLPRQPLLHLLQLELHTGGEQE